MFRVEDKYALSMQDMYVLRTRLNAIMDSDSNEAAVDGYKISSLYFDDIYDTHLADTINGNPVRQKYRIRIYNDSLESIRLEVKKKQYSRIKKVSQKISREQLNCLMCGETIACDSKDADNAVNLFNEQIRGKVLRPKVIVTYERKAFVNESGNVRITFDTGIRGSDNVERFGDAGLTYDVLREQDSVLEVKYDNFLPEYIAQTIEVNRMWQTSFSKYRMCRELFI